MPTDITGFDYDIQMSGSIVGERIETQFANGYSQRQSVSLNPNRATWRVDFPAIDVNRTDLYDSGKSDLQELVDALRSPDGVLWRSPEDPVAVTYLAEGAVRWRQLSCGLVTVSVELRRIFE